ncbi:LOW QUALITY PROTEIN: hypothetical protein V2J09_001386 [Rumex salicifolius]
MADSASELVTWGEIELCESNKYILSLLGNVYHDSFMVLLFNNTKIFASGPIYIWGSYSDPSSSYDPCITSLSHPLCSYLLCHMFEEAAALAASILTRVVANQSLCNELHDVLLQDIMESAAMVLVQSSGELGRTSELLNELKKYYGSTAAIPVEVLLTGACVQVSNGHSSSAQEFLEDFLSKWRFENAKYIAVADSNMHVTYAGGADLNPVLEADQYIKVVEFYVVTLLGMVLNNPSRATLWIEKAQMPEEARQDLTRRVESLCSRKSTSEVLKSSLVDEQEMKLDEPKKSQMIQNGSYSDGPNIKKQPILKRPGRLEQYFSWLRNVIVSHGNTYTAASKMRMLPDLHSLLQTTQAATCHNKVCQKSFAVIKARTSGLVATCIFTSGEPFGCSAIASYPKPKKLNDNKSSSVCMVLIPTWDVWSLNISGCILKDCSVIKKINNAHNCAECKFS